MEVSQVAGAAVAKPMTNTVVTATTRKLTPFELGNLTST
jgi:hypothetical protein